MRHSSPYQPLPNGTDKTRLCGIEIEFTGLTEVEAADLVAETLGGEVEHVGRRAYEIGDTVLGTLRIELDTALRKSPAGALVDLGLDLARRVVPVELITPPLTPDQLPLLDRLRRALCEAGALGSRDGLLFGFGVHLNPEVPHDNAQTARTILAFGLLEDWLHRSNPVDLTRRFLPFISPWPHALIETLVDAETQSLADLALLYSDHTSSRNHGLDLMPLFRHLDPDRFELLFPGAQTAARPTFHFRLPDCRIDEPGWTLADPWQMWQIVETVANDTDLLAALCADWQRFSATAAGLASARRRTWADQVAQRIGDGPTRAAA